MKPLLIFDGDCGFCRSWVRYWQKLTGDRVEYAPSQEAAPRFPEIPAEQFAQAVVWVDSEGKVSVGAEAVFQLLALVSGKSWWLKLYRSFPPFAWASEFAYRIVAANRYLFSRATVWLWGKNIEPESHRATRWLFLRALGAIYFLAFASLFTQVAGLIGHDGILPLDRFLSAVHSQVGARGYWLLPTLSWLDPSNGFLLFLCGGGCVLSLLLIFDFAPGPILLILWAFYLSLVSDGQEFLSFQWDILLLETGFLAIFLAPWRLQPFYLKRRGQSEGDAPPSKGVVWLLRFLLFRLMFESGCVKLLSGDKTWRSLTALYYHYETQPLPTWIGYYAHQLPQWFQRFSVGSVFTIELLVPWLLFLPRRPRILAAGFIVFFQVLIGLTGNYCFFNLITVALCLFALDDAFLKDWAPSLHPGESGEALPKSTGTESAPQRWSASRLRPWVIAPLAALVLFMGLTQLYGMLRRRAPELPAPLVSVIDAVSPLHLVNTYGLFAVMTTVRAEIVIEGSADGRIWSEYVFRYKPQGLDVRPKFIEPFQPRLDWQMWFAVLGNYQQNPWFLNFLVRLLQGKPDVLSLLKNNPFPVEPPRYMRATLFDYHFTTLAEKRTTGNWWKREQEGLYCPILVRKGGS